MKIKQTYVFLILLITCCNAYPQKTEGSLSAIYTFDKDEEKGAYDNYTGNND